MKPLLAFTTALIFVGSLFAGFAFADEVEDFCAGEWEVDGSLYTQCVNDQNTAKAKVQNFTGPTRQLCADRWGDDYVSTLECVEEQSRAEAYLDSLPGSPELTDCRLGGDGDFEVIAYCVDENWDSASGPLGIPLDGPATAVASPAPSSSGFYILRAVKKLEGPLYLETVNADGTLNLSGAKGQRVTKLSAVETTMPRKAADFLVSRLSGRELYLEVDRVDASLSYLYTAAPFGEWGNWAGDVRLEQVNVTLVEAGFAAPAAAPTEDRYTHFYESAARRAESYNLGMWAGR